MMVHPLYLVSALSGLAFLALMLKKNKPEPKNQYIDIEPTPQTNPPPLQTQSSPKREKTARSSAKIPDILTIYLVPKTPIDGSELLAFFLSHNLQYDANQQIFHLSTDHSIAFYVATLSSPGTFDLKTMTQSSFIGLSFFAPLGDTPSPLEDFDTLCNILFEAKDQFNAQLQSQNKEPIDLNELKTLRDTILQCEV